MQTHKTPARPLQSEKHVILEIVEYIPNSVVRKTIIKQAAGSMTAVAVDEGEMFCEKTSESDTFVQVIDGKAEISIGKKELTLSVGQGLLIPEKTVYCFVANEEFKLIITILKDNE